ncbi:MAG TPA: MAPEG family protein [Caulobacterales bacterium]|nr:MAPEG family protein [Caulobacterales bacterium]
MVRLEIAALYAGVNILILLVLGALVVRGRIGHNIALGDAGHKDMLRLMRAHANAAEYIPAALVGILILALLDPAAPPWLLHASGVTLTAGRIFHGVGMQMGVLNIGRRVGMLLTFAAYLLIGGGLIYAGLAKQL